MVIKFNKKQMEALELIRSKINTKEIITITGIAGAGKTFTILNIFSELHEITKNKTICFCAPTNNVVERSKQNKEELEKHLKQLIFVQQVHYWVKNLDLMKMEKKNSI